MKIITTVIALSLATSWSAFGKAYFFTRTELIERAAVIAIVSLEEPEEVQPVGESHDPFAQKGATGKNWSYAKQAKAHVEKILKGKIPENFVLYGQESFICAQCPLSKGRFLALLSKDGELWVGANWQLSLRPLKDGEVEWYVSEEQRFPMEFQKLEEVVAYIQEALKKQESAQANPAKPESKPAGEAPAKEQPSSPPAEQVFTISRPANGRYTPKRDKNDRGFAGEIVTIKDQTFRFERFTDCADEETPDYTGKLQVFEDHIFLDHPGIRFPYRIAGVLDGRPVLLKWKAYQAWKKGNRIGYDILYLQKAEVDVQEADPANPESKPAEKAPAKD